MNIRNPVFNLFSYSPVQYYSWLQGKSALPCRTRTTQGLIQQAMSNSCNKDPFDGITKSDVKDAATVLKSCFEHSVVS